MLIMMTTSGRIMRRKMTRMTTATRWTTMTRISQLWDLKRMIINVMQTKIRAQKLDFLGRVTL